MKAAVLYSTGGPGNFIIEDRPVPIPQKGQVLVRVKAFGLNRAEVMTRKGYSPNVKFPRILGIECAGEIVTDPEEQFTPGQKVVAVMGDMGRAYDGSYAEYTVLPKAIITPIASTLPWSILGAVPEMYHTVNGSLNLALKLNKGDVLLIRGATSSIGMLACQLAKENAASIIATTRNNTKSEWLTSNGADHVIIDDGQIHKSVRQLFPEGVHKVLDLVGTPTLRDSLLCSCPSGTVCMTGMLSEQWSIAAFAPMEFIPATVYLTVYDSGQFSMDQPGFQQFLADVETGKYKVSISNIFTLNQISAAHNYMESNKGAGKIVVVNG